MTTLAKLLYVETDEEVTDLVDRLRDLHDQEAVSFVVPAGARSLQSPMSFRLLKRYADAYGKQVSLISPDARLQTLGVESGFTVYPNLQSYESGAEVHDEGDAPGVPAFAEPEASAVVIAPAAHVGPKIGTSAPAEPVRTRGWTTDVVSTTPKSKPAPPPPTGRRGPRLPQDRRLYYAGGAAVALVALLFLVFFVPTADVRITVTGTQLKTDMQLIGMVNPVSGTVDHFPTQVITATEMLTAQGTATGQKTVPAVAATGQVVFTYNCTGSLCGSGTLPIPAGVHLSTPDGKHYTTQKAVTVNVPQGTATAPISATGSGAGGNTGANTVTTIENGHPDDLSVTNPIAISGGADQRVATVIQQSDLDAVTQVLTSQLSPKVQADLTTKGKGQHLVAAGQPSVLSSTDHQLGEEVPGFTMTMTITANGVVFDNAAVTKLLRDALQRKVPVGSTLTTDQAKIAFDVGPATGDGTVTLTGHASAYSVIVFSQEAIRAHVAGTSPSSARAFLQSLPNVVDVTVRQDPFGLPWLPFFSSHITVNIQEVTGTAAP